MEKTYDVMEKPKKNEVVIKKTVMDHVNYLFYLDYVFIVVILTCIKTFVGKYHQCRNKGRTIEYIY